MFSLMSKATALVAVGAVRPGLAALAPASTMQTPEDQAPDLASLLERVDMAANDLDIVGRDNESIRNRCQDIVAKVANAATLGEDLAVVFGQVDALIRELEQTKSELIQRNAIFAIERDAHVDLKFRFKALHDETESHKADNDVLRAEAERLKAAIEAAEARVEELETSLEASTTLVANGEQERQDLQFRVSFLTDELRATQQRMLDADAALSGVQSELAAEKHNLALLEQNNLSLQNSLADAQAQAARFRTDLEDANIGWENSRQQLMQRDAETATLQAEHARMRGLWQQATDAHRADVAALQAQVDGLNSRAEVTDRLLTESRNELQAKSDELRLEERRMQDAAAAASVLEQNLQTAENVNAELNKRASELEEANRALSQRIKPLNKELKEKDAEIAKLQQQFESAQTRMTSEAERFAADMERAQDQIKTLTEGYEREKVLKALAEGALEVDRRERVQLQHALQSARSGQAISDRAQG